MSLEQNVENAKRAVQWVKREILDAGADVKMHEEELAHAKERLRGLTGRWGHSGHLQEAEMALKRAEMAMKDDSALVVVWKVKRDWGDPHNREWIVDKITKKRIYIRIKDSLDQLSYYNRETGAGTNKYEGVIDIEATFPEGIDA